MNKEYFPLVEAAAYLGVSRAKLSRLIKEGAVPYTVSPLDKRFKLLKRADLDRLTAVPRPVWKRSD